MDVKKAIGALVGISVIAATGIIGVRSVTPESMDTPGLTKGTVVRKEDLSRQQITEWRLENGRTVPRVTEHKDKWFVWIKDGGDEARIPVSLQDYKNLRLGDTYDFLKPVATMIPVSNDDVQR